MARNRTSEDAELPAGGTVDNAPALAESAGATPEQPAPPAPSPEATEKPPSGPEFSVAQGRSVVCLKGTIDEGQPIRAMDLAGGEEALAALVKSGVVDDNRPKA